jgi:predicted small integral membrane protein
MIIPGHIISIITFPGVIVHELAHQLFCYLCNIKVYKVKYFQFGNPSGYVVHEGTDHPGKVFITSMGPFFFNTLLGSLIILPSSIEFFAFKVNGNILNLINVWTGFSILMHSFPSTGDAKVMVQQIIKNKKVNIFIKILVAPWIALVYIGAVGSVAWLDALYATSVAMLLPNVLIRLF